MRLSLASLLALASATVGAVDLEVPGDFATIQAAIDAADVGDVVLIAPGVYEENITLRSGVDVRGVETARTLLGPETSVDPTIRLQGISDVLLANLTIVDSTIGVIVTDVTDVRIANVVIDAATNAAIDIDASPDVTVENSVFFENATAIRRLSGAPEIFNNLFARNVSTIDSPIGFLDTNVSFNGFFDNDDLAQGDIDTGLGTDFQLGDPRFVDVDVRDFHLRAGSPAIDAGTGTDVIDDTVADLGVYGGPQADPTPFPVSGVTLTNTSAADLPPFAITARWDPNLDYRVTDGVTEGSYRVYYELNDAGPPYEGTDAGGGTQPSPIDVGLETSFELEDLSPAIDAPLAPRLLQADARNESVVLSWEAVSGATGYRVIHAPIGGNESVIDVGDVTRATVTGLENGTTYRFSIVAFRRPVYHVAVTVLDGTQDRHESAFSADEEIALGPASASAPSNELTATPEVTEPVPDLPDKGCFVATAAFGASWQPQVEILREFRDRYLMRIPVGRQLVAWYYEHGPIGAVWLDAHEPVKPVVRILLWPFVVLALTALGAGPGHAVALAGLGIGWIAARQVRGVRQGVMP